MAPARDARCGAAHRRACSQIAAARWRAPHAAVGISLIALSAATPAWGATSRFSASASATETYTSNVNFDPGGQAESDFVTLITGTVSFDRQAARLKLRGSLGATEVIHANGNNGNSFAPTADITGTLEAIENFFFVDASATVSQTYASPFGPQPQDLAISSTNRYTSQTYRVSPYVRGVLNNNVSYQLRDDNTWTNASSFGNSGTSIPGTYSNTITGSMSSTVARWGWSLDYSRDRYDNGLTDGTSVKEITRGALNYAIDPALQVGLRGGYENDRLLQTRQSSVIYGVSARWMPTERTNVDGFWEHRFFGSAYSATLSHRLPRAAITASFTRDLSNYPQNALAIPVGANVAAYLDAAFTTRIPDPVERAVAVQEFIARNALPATLLTPVNFFATTFQLQTSQTASMVLLGVRNSITFTIFHTTSARVDESDVPVPVNVGSGQNSTQTGIGVSASHTLSGFTNLTAFANLSEAHSDAQDVTTGNTRSKNASFGFGASHRFSPKTSGSLGASYTRFLPSGGENAAGSSALNVFATITHTF